MKPPTPPALQYDPETQALVDAANSARNLFDEAERRLREIEREVRKLEESDSKDYGLDEEFQPLEGHCFDYTDREYTYRLCPFDNASQRPKQGGSETRLGSWDSWDGPADDKYSRMKYDRGVQCWNGPQRSAKVWMLFLSSSIGGLTFGFLLLLLSNFVNPVKFEVGQGSQSFTFVSC